MELSLTRTHCIPFVLLKNKLPQIGGLQPHIYYVTVPEGQQLKYSLIGPIAEGVGSHRFA